MHRVHLTAEDVSTAILNAGIELRPEDCMVTKFYQIADELGEKIRRQVRGQLEDFSNKALW